MRNKYIVWLLTVGIVTAILCIGVVARESLYHYKQESIPVISDTVYIDQDIKEDQSITAKFLELTLNGDHNKTFNLDNYFLYLQNYLNSTEVTLQEYGEERLKDLLRELITIMNLENESDIQNMSIDGREIATNLLTNIYELYGLKVMFSMDGEIQKVEDPSGIILYQNKDQIMESEFQILSLLLVVFFFSVFTCLSVLIAKKKQIFVKDVDFDGFDEKKYA
jgi:hypothetical protein